MNDCRNGSSDQKECCKAAVEAYKQVSEERNAKWYLRGLALLIPVELAYLWPGHWDFINIMFSIVAFLCWVNIFLDFYKWIKGKNQPKT